MKITVFNGSHYRGKSNTQLMVDEFLAGASAAGAKTESIRLIDRNVQPCTTCTKCFVDGICPIEDDMPLLIQKFLDSDIVVFAAPLYMDMVSGLTKIFIDRLMPLLDPHFEQDENGEYRHFKRNNKFPDLAVISNGHMPEQTQFQVIKLFMARLARSLHTQVVAEIYRSSGGILNSDDEAFKPAIRAYRQLLREAGRELVTKGRITDHTSALLERDIVPVEEYITYANKMWDKLLNVGVR
jgi:multimeric flavodoxin WrbA